jgi:4-diphosphocytidyl-2-C-methyl-D-erythritol kinase
MDMAESPVSVQPPWPSPAKLNLFLHVTGRRPDGYHLLQTVFQFIDLCDELYFEPRDDGRIVRIDPLPGIAPEQDITVRAARLLQARAGGSAGAAIRINKRIPVGGGLGGGSSNAATALWALNRLWGLGLDIDELAGIGLTLGADVPVFVRGQAAWAEGVGERLIPIPLDEPWYLVIVPPVQVSTASIFAAPDLTRDCELLTIDRFLSGDQGLNVCEPVVCSRYPEVAKALGWLRRHVPATMSGTGSCVFARFEDRQAAEALHACLPAGWRGFVARGMNRSPLLARIGDSEFDRGRGKL